MKRRAWTKIWRQEHPGKQAEYNRRYYAGKRAKGWKDPTLKARLRKLRDKKRKRAYVPRRSRATMRALRAAQTIPMRGVTLPVFAVKNGPTPF